MIDCPRLDELQRLLANPRDEQAWETLHAHLDRCPTCRERIDTLHATNTQIPSQPGRWQPPPSSAALDRVVAKLQDAAPHAAASATAPATGGYPLSFLRPIDREGYLGRLGNYAVRRVIGRGGMGMVLEAEDPVLKRTVAIKIISPWAVLDEETRSRFLREAQAAAAITHENVVAIHAVDEVDGLPFLVLEYVAGESLDGRLRRDGALPLTQVVRLGAELARGLAAAHVKSLIHRDIKPANILLAEDTERAKIADFGLARTGGEDALTMTGTLLGTPEFMSPEQAQGQEPDERSDLFSLGAVLYVAATGVSPFRGATLFDTLDNVRRCQPRPLGELDASLPDWFCDLVHRLLAKNPQARIGWATVVATLFEQASTAKTLVDFRPSQPTAKIPLPRAVLPKSRRIWLAAAAVLIAVSLVAVGSWSWYERSNRPTQSFAVKPVPAANKAPPAALVPLGFTIEGHTEHFSTLAAAIAAAEDGHSIEVHGNGPFLTPPLTITGKRLTIRAAVGSLPVFLSETPTATAKQPLLQTDSDLRLEGLEIHWSIEPRQGISEAEMLARSIVVATHGRLDVLHCRIVSSRLNGCIGGACRNVVIRNSHLLAKNGMGVFWRQEPGGRLDIDGCILENHFGIDLLAGSGATDTPGRIRLSHNTLAAVQAVQLILESQPRQPIPFVVEHNLVDAEYLFVLMAARLGPRAKSALNLDDRPSLLRSWVAWSEEGNVYRRGIKFVARPAAGQKSLPQAADIPSLDRWLELWKLPASRSIDGEILFSARPEASKAVPRVLDAVNDPSGLVPADVGARPDQVGPGAAYDAWRKSPEYGRWPSL